MLDFTSSLYLGMRHPQDQLAPWRQLTTGRPAALGSSAEETKTAQAFAHFVKCEDAALGPSTLHLFWDLFDTLVQDGITIHVDAGTYPIALWGVERASAKGVKTATFQKHAPAALSEALRRASPSGLRPVVLTDGLCPLTGRPAPLLDYATLVRRFDGFLVIDDTQALGLLGDAPSPAAPYGVNGNGTPGWHGLAGSEVIVISSLAKGFGAPLATISGSHQTIELFKARSLTRVHCSPPSIAAIRAADNALELNAAHGPARRRRLIELVCYFRDGLRTIGLSAHGDLFPFQTVTSIVGEDAIALHANLLRAGVKTVLHRVHQRSDALISFLINALHTHAEIEAAIRALRRHCRPALMEGTPRLAI